jgi:hypothetical protein
MKGKVTFEGVRAWAVDPAAVRARLDELVMAWAADRYTGAAKYILEVDRGLRCQCVCPGCGSQLAAVNSRNPNWRKRPHFRHTAGIETHECAVLSARHALLWALTDRTGSDALSFDLPARTVNAQTTGLSGRVYAGSASAATMRVVPEAVTLVDAQSVVIRLRDGRQIFVQVLATLERQSDVPAEHRAVIQVVASPRDLSALAGLSPDEVRAGLRVLLGQGQWCRHWEDEALKGAATLAAVNEASLHIDVDEGLDDERANTYESALHLAVKQIIEEAREINLPSLEARIERDAGTAYQWVREWSSGPWRASFGEVGLETRLGRAIPDVVAHGSDGTVCIEVTVANPLDSSRAERYEAMGAAVLEIDLRVFSGRVTRKELRALVVDGIEGKRWVCHPRLSAERQRLIDAYEAEGFCCNSGVGISEALRRQAFRRPASRTDWLRTRLDL